MAGGADEGEGELVDGYISGHDAGRGVLERQNAALRSNTRLFLSVMLVDVICDVS